MGLPNEDLNLRLGRTTEPSMLLHRLVSITCLALTGRMSPELAPIDHLGQLSYVVRGPGVIIVGVGARRPHMFSEIAVASSQRGMDGIIVRLGSATATAMATFDIKQAGAPKILCAYRLWMGGPSEQAWLVPALGEAIFVRMDPTGLEFLTEAPFDTDYDRWSGFARGREFLSIAWRWF